MPCDSTGTQVETTDALLTTNVSHNVDRATERTLKQHTPTSASSLSTSSGRIPSHGLTQFRSFRVYGLTKVPTSE